MLALILTPLHVKVGSEVHFMQLAGILLGGGKPALQSFLELLRGCRRQGTEVGVYGQVIAHGVAFHNTTHPIDINGLAARLTARGGKPHLVVPNGCEIG